MKALNLKITLPLFLITVCLNSFGQTPATTNTAPATDTSRKGKTDTGKKAANLSVSGTNNNKSASPGTTDTLIGKTFIVNYNLKITECGSSGEKRLNPTSPVIIRGTRFLVTGTNGGEEVILVNIWGLSKKTEKYDTIVQHMLGLTNRIDTTELSSREKNVFKKNEKDIFMRIDAVGKRKNFNFKQYAQEQFAPNTTQLDSLNNNRYYFLLSADSIKKYCTEYKPIKNYNINFGVLSTPFKLRVRKFSFSNNLSVGGAVSYQRKFTSNPDLSWGLVFGLSLSSVTLDAASTNVHPEATATTPASANTPTSPITTSTTRPAFTPSFHYMISYKNINFIIGGGADFISKTTDIATPANPEAGWIYNGKPWIGIGFGVSLFNNNSSSKTTPALPDQSDSAVGH